MTTKILQAVYTSSARNAVILTITISMIFAGAWSVQDSIMANAAKPQNNGELYKLFLPIQFRFCLDENSYELLKFDQDE